MSKALIVSLPSEAQASSVQLSWWHIASSMVGAFSIDNVLIGPSTFEAGSTYSDTFELGINTDLWWSLSNEVDTVQACGQSRALMLGSNDDEGMAITKPLSIPATPTTNSVLVYEGFDVPVSDRTRLIAEGWEFSADISSMCGFVFGNGTSLVFSSNGERRVVTKLVDTTNANYVGFYLLFGGSDCNGIDNEDQGVQLSYMNDNTNGWIQIAYYSDTILFASPQSVLEALPVSAQGPNTRLRWYQPNYDASPAADLWSIDEIQIFDKPVGYNLQFSYTTGCNTATPSEIEVEYLSRYTSCTWRTIQTSVLPSSCEDLRTTYVQSSQFRTSSWSKVTLPLPLNAMSSNTQIRWKGQSNCPECQFYLDNVFIRPGCPNNCNDHGRCTDNKCRCDAGYSGSACLPTSLVRELREDFSQYPLSSTLWSSVQGNNENTLIRCGRLTGSYSVSFSGSSIRELVTTDVNTLNAYYIEFYFRLGGSTMCNSPNSPSESVILQYSIDGGVSWDNIAIMCYSQYHTSTHISLELTPDAQTTATRFRWWQPAHKGSNLDEWAITDLYIGGNLAQNSILETFDPINNDYWLFYSGAEVSSHCVSQGNALVFARDGFVSTKDFYVTSGYIIQFDINLLACDCSSPLANFSRVQLEYSNDRGNIWRLLSSDTIYSPLEHQQWNHILVSIPDIIVNQTLRFRWVQPDSGYSCWAIDNVNITNFCFECIAPQNEVVDDFADSQVTSSQWQLPFNFGRIVSGMCDRSNRILQFSMVNLPAFAATKTIILGSEAFIQFDLVFGCENTITNLESVSLQYSTDGITWNLVQEPCLLPNNCEQFKFGSVYYSSVYSAWRRVLVEVPNMLINIPVELRLWSGGSSSYDWAIDNVYIGNGCSSVCIQNGICTGSTCNCDDRFSGVLCLPNLIYSVAKENFDNGDAMLSAQWPIATGGSILSAGIASGNALVFSNSGIRYIESVGLDLSEASFLQLAIQLHGTVTIDKAILVEFFALGDNSWTTLTRLYYRNVKRNTDESAPMEIITYIPSNAQTQATKIRLWQPIILEEGDAVWGIDDFYIGGNTNAPLSVVTDFSSALPPEQWPSYSGGIVGSSYCGRNNVVLFDNSSSGLHHIATTFLDLAGGTNLLQFEINVGCGYNTGTLGAVSLEYYYLNSNASWSLLIDRCSSTGQCYNSQEETFYYSVNYGEWTRITIAIDEDSSSRLKSFRWNQGYVAVGTQHPTWALSNVYIGLPNNCPNLCSGHGMCTVSGCRCDTGYIHPMCMPSAPIPQSLTDDFTSGQIDSTKWSEVFGGSIGTTCGLPGQSYVLYFNQPGIRKAVTIDLNLQTAESVSFHINVGVNSNGCIVPQNSNENVLFQYSTNGGATWSTILTVPHNDNNAEKKSVTLPIAARSTLTRLRWWQPSNPGLNLAEWSLDNVNINVMEVVLDGFYEDFESSVETFIEYDGTISSYCMSNGKALVLSEETDTTAVTESIRFSDGILMLQFQMATSCGGFVNGGRSAVAIEISYDNGVTWQQAISPCSTAEDLSCLITRFFTPSVWGWQYTDGWFRYTVSLARLPMRNKVGKLRWRKLNEEQLSLDEIYIGTECVNQCYLHGNCRDGVCICDDGYEGDDCSSVKNGQYMIKDIIESFDKSLINSILWSQISGGIIRETCPSEPREGTSLHFNGEGFRSAVTQLFDARNVEEFSFTFYYGDDCNLPGSGSQITVAMSVDFGISWTVIKILGAQIPQGTITVPVSKELRVRNAMIGWYQLQHGEDTWTLDNVNVTLSLDTTSGQTTSTSRSGTPSWAWGAIGGVIIVIIVVVLVVAFVIIKTRRRTKSFSVDVPVQSNPVQNTITEFQNPLFGEMEGSSMESYYKDTKLMKTE